MRQNMKMKKVSFKATLVMGFVAMVLVSIISCVCCYAQSLEDSLNDTQKQLTRTERKLEAAAKDKEEFFKTLSSGNVAWDMIQIGNTYYYVNRNDNGSYIFTSVEK